MGLSPLPWWGASQANVGRTVPGRVSAFVGSLGEEAADLLNDLGAAAFRTPRFFAVVLANPHRDGELASALSALVIIGWHGVPFIQTGPSIICTPIQYRQCLQPKQGSIGFCVPTYRKQVPAYPKRPCLHASRARGRRVDQRQRRCSCRQLLRRMTCFLMRSRVLFETESGARWDPSQPDRRPGIRRSPCPGGKERKGSSPRWPRSA